VSVILAVDPGLSGAVARFCPQEKRLTILRDFKSLPDIARAVKTLAIGVDYAVIELVHAMPGQGVCSMFSFGRAAGVADGALVLSLPELVVESVSPQKWQNAFRKWYNIPKEVAFDSRAIATKFFPDFAHYFTRKKDHNSADAALIAVWKAAQLSQSPP
jgi:crossover junction endodeoxyribonuclease RuvC